MEKFNFERSFSVPEIAMGKFILEVPRIFALPWVYNSGLATLCYPRVFAVDSLWSLSLSQGAGSDATGPLQAQDHTRVTLFTSAKDPLTEATTTGFFTLGDARPFLR